MSPSEENSTLKKDIEETIKIYNNLLESIVEKNLNEINQMLWSVRSNLESIVIELKTITKDSILKEKWQDDFHNNLKGTKSKDKAISKLREYNLKTNDVINLFTKRKDDCYQYLWKLKEVISSVISAFPETRYKWVNNQLQEKKEKIFEI